MSSVVRRRGRGKFRRGLLSAYCGRCAITGCAVEERFSNRAHIIPYRGPDTDHVTNGLLPSGPTCILLFDLGLVAVEVETMTLLGFLPRSQAPRV